MKIETTTQRKRRLAKQRQKRIEKNSALSSDELIEIRRKRRLYMRNYRDIQSEEERTARLEQMRRHNAEIRASLSEEERTVRLEYMRQHNRERRESHRNIERPSGLEKLRTRNEPASPEPQIKGECYTSTSKAISSKSPSMDTPHDYVSVKVEPVEEPELAPDVPSAPHVCVKQEPESCELADVIKEEDSDEAARETSRGAGVSEAAMLAGLYAGHVVKDELVLGPEVTTRPHVTSLHDACCGQIALRDCSVRLERCDAPRGATTPDPATESPTPRHDTAPQPTDLNAGNTYVCDICGKLFKRKYDIIRHVNRHSRETSKIVSNKSNVYKRVRASVKYACDICNKEFSELGYLRRHQRDHPAPNTYVCDICGKLIKRKDHLIRHVNRHLRENSEVLSNKSNIYERVRTSVKYACEICKKEFSRLDNLQRHQRLHTGDKPYSCEICQKKFAEFGNLKEHKRIHTGEKPYSCDICKKQFAVLRTMSKHKRTHCNVARSCIHNYK